MAREFLDSDGDRWIEQADGYFRSPGLRPMSLDEIRNTFGPVSEVTSNDALLGEFLAELGEFLTGYAERMRGGH
jgi:hypothetical protein